MPYITRNNNSHIIRLAEQPEFDGQEFLDESHSDISSYREIVSEIEKNQSYLKDSDLDLIRVSEDLIDLLITNNLIMFTDLPSAAQKKLTQRTSARTKMNSLDSIIVDEDSIL